MGIEAPERADRLHLVLTALLGLALWPVCHLLGLRFGVGGSGFVWLFVIGVRCLPVAALMGALDAPERAVAMLRRRALRVALFAVAGFCLAWMVGVIAGSLIAIDAFLLLEFFESNPGKRTETVSALLVPGFYFVLGFSLVVLWNDVIVSVRYFATSDALLASIDRALMFGSSVRDVSAWCARFPRFIVVADYVYFLMFRVMAAGVILLILDRGLRRGLRAIGTILLAYYIAMAIFFVIPGKGPYLGDDGHFAAFSGALSTVVYQKLLIEQAGALWHHGPGAAIQGGYYIAFPSMHIVQPLIVACFLRHRPRLFTVLCTYLIALAVAIVVLDWHYLVDILGGIAVAYVALRLCGENPRRIAFA